MSDKKELIRNTAIYVFAEKGFYNTTTDEIAKKAGVAVGTIYNYFKNKQDILEYIFQVEFDKRHEYFQKISTQPKQPVEKIELIIEKHLDEVEANPDIVKIILNERQNTRNYPCKESGLKRFIKEIVIEGKEKDMLRENTDADLVATIIFGSIEGIMREYLEKKEVIPSPGVFFERALSEIELLLKKGLERHND